MSDKKVIGYTTGIFDLFHIGHLNLLKRAKLACDYLIVGVSTDALCEKLKDKTPVIPFVERIEIVKSIKFVDRVVPEETDDKLAAQKTLNFDIIFKGDDWKGTEKWNKLETEFKKIGVEVMYFPYTAGTTSSIILKVLEQKII